MKIMRVLSLAALMVFLFAACDKASTTGSDVVIESEEAPEGATLVPYEDTPGLVRATVRVGELITLEGDLLDGKRHGSWIEFDTQGPVKSLITYMNGKRHGVSLVFDRNGTVSQKSIYSNGLLHGEFKDFNRRRLIEEKTYVKGKLEGVVKKYYTSGTVMQEAPYKNGLMDGLAKWYDEDGNVSIAYLYENGDLVDKDPELD
ncbi:MAG: toxin-antitoxin system YwqK family antitoxin [Cyclobacteriaceae bacterium]